MFFKTLKHDLINSFRDYLNLYLIMIFIAVLGPFAIKSGNNFLVGFTMMSIVVLFIMSFILTLMNAIGFLKRRLFEDGAYFNLTLPVSLDTTLLSKLVTVNIWFFITLLIGTLSIFVFAISFDPDLLNALQASLRQLIEVLSRIKWWQFVLTFLNLLTSLFSGLALVLLSMTLVNTSLFKRTNYLISIVIFFVISFVSQWVITFIFELIVGRPEQIAYQSDILLNLSTPYSGIVQIALNLLMFIIFYGLTRYLFDSKLEI